MTRFKVVPTEHPAVQNVSNQRAGRLRSVASMEARRK